VTDRREADEELLAMGAAPGLACDRFANGAWSKTTVCAPRELALTIYVNTQELVTVLCTPSKLTPLVVGFLYSEGIIKSMRDVAAMRVCEDDAVADVKLVSNDFKPPTRRMLTSGCGGGVVFAPKVQKVESSLRVTPEELLALMKSLNETARLYRVCGGVHTSVLADNAHSLVLAEDIGRHNTLDRIQGECLLRGLSTRDKVLLSTGRISSEMLLKAASMGIPVVVSRSAPTDRAVELAKEAGITVVGYARGERLSVYSHTERVTASRAENK